MTPEQRNAWFASETAARRSYTESRRQLSESVNEQMKIESGYYNPPTQTSPPSNYNQTSYWQEQNARQEYLNRTIYHVGAIDSIPFIGIEHCFLLIEIWQG